MSAKVLEQEFSEAVTSRAQQLYAEQKLSIARHTDYLISRLMICQWVFAAALTIWVTPYTWSGIHSQIHLHVWAALLLGGLITSVPVFLALSQPGHLLTRQSIAVGQMLMSALLIHLTGGRIETHFHVFGSLAILAFYRDVRVLISAAIVVVIDHMLRGIFWPESVFGVMTPSFWRAIEHGGWVIFEVSFLTLSIRKSHSEMKLVAERQARLEALKAGVENAVRERTADLMSEVSERRATEVRLKKSEALLAQAQHVAQLGSWEWDLASNEISWSEEMKRLFGRPPKDPNTPWQNIREQVHPVDLPRVRQVMDEAVAAKTSFVVEHRVILPDGSLRIMQGRGQTEVDATGKPVRMIGITQDVTEVKQADEALQRSEAQLRQSQKMEAVGRLAGGVAHDFNNLLTVISGYSALSLNAIPEENALRRNLNEIQKAAERAASLTAQLLAFSRKQVLQPRVVNLDKTVIDMEKMLRRLIGEDIELVTDFAPDVGNVIMDPSQLEQVILNLAVNARDAMPRGGKLTIGIHNVRVDQQSSSRNRTLEIGDYVVLSLSDNGMGMNDETKSHLFEPFFTTKASGKGTGLGLATCYGIVTQSGGDIRVYSELNNGTTFKIFLPRTDAGTEPANVQDPNPLPNGAESILIVEDEAAVRKLAVVILRERGYQVQEAGNAFEALEMLRKHREFDLVITDVIMPQMSGKQLYDQVKSQLPAIKILLMSGYTDDALAHHGVLDDGLFFLEKPFSPSRLAKKVRQVLDDSSEKNATETASNAELVN